MASSMGVFRRCGCRDDEGRQYSVLPDRPTEAQARRACPLMLADPKHGRWSFRLSAGVDPVTKKRQQVGPPRGTSYSTKREAQQARNEVAAKVGRGSYVPPARETFAEYLPVWLERHRITGKGLRPATVENYARYIGQDIAPSGLGRMRLGDIRRHHINAFIGQLMDDGRGAVTVRRIIAVVQGALRAATVAQMIEENPATLLQLPQVQSEPFEPWEPEQVGLFLDAAARHRLGALFELAVFTGLRRSELLALRWAHVDLAAGRARVWQSKTDSGVRVVDLDDRSVGALLAWQMAQQAEAEAWGDAWGGQGHVFTYEDGEALRPQYVTRLFDRIRQEADLPRMTLHGLRHMQASLMIAAGVPLAVISKRLGHSSVSITSDIYGHLIGSASRDAANLAAQLVPSRKVSARTLHTHPAQAAAKAVPYTSETASDLPLLSRADRI